MDDYDGQILLVFFFSATSIGVIYSLNKNLPYFCVCMKKREDNMLPLVIEAY